MFMFLLMFNDLLDDFFEIINDILSLHSPKIDNDKKPPKLLGR